MTKSMLGENVIRRMSLWLRGVALLWLALVLSGPAALAAGGTGSGSIGDASEESRQLLAKFMDLSGLDRMIEQLPVLMQMGADQGWQNDQQAAVRKNPGAGEDFARFKALLAEAFAPAAFSAQLRARLAAGLDAKTLAAVVAEIEKPLHRKISEIEVANTTPEKIGEIQKYAATLAQNPPAKPRAELIRRLVKATRAAELQAEMAVRMRLVFARMALAAMADAARAEAEKKLQSVAAQIRADSLPQAETENFATGLYIYRALSDAELAQYLEFHESALGLAAVEAVNRSFVDTMEAATLTLSKKLMEGNASPRR